MTSSAQGSPTAKDDPAEHGQGWVGIRLGGSDETQGWFGQGG